MKSKANQNNLGQNSQASLASSIASACCQFTRCKIKRILILGNQREETEGGTTSTSAVGSERPLDKEEAGDRLRSC